MSGNFLEWDKNGKIIKDINYIDGQRVNEYIIYNDENYVLVVNKVRGVLEGIWEKWSLENIKIEEGTYKNGVKIGTWYRYDSGGQL